ncbi:hypothetical protein Ancab_001063 [Ancistrocladus abbreviatus]
MDNHERESHDDKMEKGSFASSDHWKALATTGEQSELADASVEKIFESREVPPWQKQLTFRAFFVSFILTILFSFIVMKFNLTTGIIPSLNVAAGLLGFFFVKTWTKFLEKSGLLKRPFTRQENTVIQTCVVTSSGIAFSDMFRTPLLCPLGQLNFPYLKSCSLLSWSLFCCSTPQDNDHRLQTHLSKRNRNCPPYQQFPYSTGCQIGKETSQTIGQILLIQLPMGFLLVVLHGRRWLWVFISIAMILGDGLYNFIKVMGHTFFSLYTQLSKKGSHAILPSNRRATSNVSQAQSYDDQRKALLFVKDQIPTWLAIAGYLVIAIISIITLPHIFPPLKWYYILVIYIFAPVLAFCNAYGCGLTDWSLASTYGNLAIFIIGAWAGKSHGGVLAGLVACRVMMNIVSTASDLTQDFKTSYMTLTSPRSMFVSQVIGTTMGCIVSPCVFWLFYKAYGTLGHQGSKYPAPYAIVFRNFAILGVEGFSALPQHCLTFCFVFFFASMVINGIRDAVGKKWNRFIPIPMAMAIPFYIGGSFAIDMCVGSLMLYVWRRMNKAKADAYGSAVASGLICGDGIWTFPNSILALARVKPPICMKFLSRAIDARVDAFLQSIKM